MKQRSAQFHSDNVTDQYNALKIPAGDSVMFEINVDGRKSNVARNITTNGSNASTPIHFTIGESYAVSDVRENSPAPEMISRVKIPTEGESRRVKAISATPMARNSKTTILFMMDLGEL